MLLTIYNLPENTRYIDVKSLVETKCGIKDMILDNLVNWGAYKKVTLGLASEEDAAMLVRKINGLFINGTQLHVEDVRKKKAMEQPYYSTNRNETYRNQHQEDQSEYMGQRNEPNLQGNMGDVANLPTYYPPSFTPHMSSGPPPQNMYNPYEGQAAIQYPTPQRMYEAPSQRHQDPHQEPLGFRSEGNASPWSHNQERNHKPTNNSYLQRDNRRWSPERGQTNERSQRPSRWSVEGSDRGGGRRQSPPRDRRPNYERAEPSTSHSAHDGNTFRRSDNRSPQRTVNFAPRANRGSNAPAFGKPREFERASFNNQKKPKAKGKDHRWPETNVHQPWANPGTFKNQSWSQKTNMPAKKRNFEQNYEEQPQKRMRRPPPILKELELPIIKKKTRLSAEEYAKVEEARSQTWRAQTAAKIADDMMEGKTTPDVHRGIFFKELKRVIRDRLAGICHPLMRHDGMYVKYRKKYKVEEDEVLFQEVMKSSKILEGSSRLKNKESAVVENVISKTETTQAQESDIKVLNEAKPLENNGGTFKIPVVPKLKPAPKVFDNQPKYTKGQMYKFKLEKQQNKRLFQHESIILDSLDPKMADALEAEATLLLERFLEECQEVDSEDKQIMERLRRSMRTTIADDFKRVVKVQVARRILNAGEPILRVFCSPKNLKKNLLMTFLKSQGITAIKKTKKHPMLLGSCVSYAVHDKLCISEPFTVHDCVITFKPLQIAGPPVKVTKDAINHQRKLFIKNQIDNNTADVDDSEMKLMNDIKELQENLDDDSFIESLVETTDELKAEKVSVEATEAGLSNQNSGSDNKKSKDNVKGESQNDSITNVKIEDFTDDVLFNETAEQKDMSADDYKIVEDTMGNFNNNEGTNDAQAGGIIDDDDDQEGGNIDNGDEQDGGNTDDIDEESGKMIDEDSGNIDGENGGNIDDVDEEDGGNVDDVDEEDGGNVDDVGEEDGGNVDEEDGANMDDDDEHGEDIDDDNCEDLEIGDIDENDLEDY